MVSTLRNYTARATKTGRSIRFPQTKEKLKVEDSPDGLTLSGSGWHHDISVKGDRVEVSDLTNTEAKTSFDKLPYMEDNRRTAIGVAAVLTGLPVVAFTGEEPERIYVNLAHRGGMGIRRDGSRMGGRYRVTQMDRKLYGSYTVHGTESWRGQIMQVGRGRNRHTPSTDFETRSGRPITTDSAFRRMTGNHFSEQIQSGLTDIWREAGKPETPGEAAKVADQVFDTLYSYEENYSIFHAHEKTEDILWNLENLPPEDSWSVMKDVSDNNLSVDQMANRLEAQFEN